MIIKKIFIENYLCYFGRNEFNLGDGLNIIIGDNGEGKTKFYDAVSWLFDRNRDNSNLDILVSAKALDEILVGDCVTVRVSMTIEQYEKKKIITKYFDAEKTGDGECEISNFTIDGIEENDKGERVPIDGTSLLDRVFPPTIRRYSMFKGESQLNIFNNKEALGNLIDSFSSAKYYRKYVDTGGYLKDKAEAAVNKATRLNKKKRQEYDRLENQIKHLKKEEEKYDTYKNKCEDQIDKVEENIEGAEKYVSNANAFEKVNKRIELIEKSMSDLEFSIDENYTTSLFDESWLLVNFENTQKAFAKKVVKLSKERRTAQSQFDKEIGMREGKEELRNKLLNDLVPLQVGVPSKAHMEEMLNDKICKVCNTLAPEGSDQYNFMKKRLDAYLKSQIPTVENETEKGALYKKDYTSRLFTMSVSHEDNLAGLRDVRRDIKELFKFNASRKKDIADLEEKLKIEIDERNNIIGSSSIGGDRLPIVLENYNSWQEDLKELNRENFGYENRLSQIKKNLNDEKAKKDKIDIESANNFLIKTREVIRDIQQIFDDTKDRKYDEFIKLLEKKSNQIMKRINVDDFTGNIVITKSAHGEKSNISIDLFQNDRKFHKPNESLETSKHMSVLFAISELASDIREENFPMIFDAPTSSFGEVKTKDFLNVIFETGKQRIILFYDFVGKNEDGTLFIKPEFKEVKRDKAFWIKRQRPFDKNVLSTINTDVINL